MFTPTLVGHLFGQSHIWPLVESWLGDPSKIPHTLLIQGPYGNGKTSLARMLAHKLTNVPRDIREINAAEARGIDDVRGWLEMSKYCPLGQANVWIFDELHQLTNAAQSALLKVIESVPAHTYYFLCTNEAAKLLPTIRSRCTPIEVKLLSKESCDELMQFLSKGKLSQEIRDRIYYRSRGHARDVVKLTELALSMDITNSEEFQSKLGPGIENVIQILNQAFSGTPVHMNHIQWVYQFPDENALVSAVSGTIDELVFVNPKLKQAYGEILSMRVHYKNHLISSREVLNHALSLADLQIVS